MQFSPSRDDDALGDECVHLCVDMQRLFAAGTAWSFSWMPRILPGIVTLCEHHAARSVFTRFIPARRPGDGQGMWRRYYSRWADMTLEALGAEAVELVPDLEDFVPPGQTLDKPVYSPWLGTDLHATLQARRCNTLVVTGGETDMCVLATILGAVDLGYRTIVVKDALCSSSDASHDAMIQLYGRRFGQQIELRNLEQVLDLWSS